MTRRASAIAIGLLTLVTATLGSLLSGPAANAATGQPANRTGLSAVVSADCTNGRLQLALDNRSPDQVAVTVNWLGSPNPPRTVTLASGDTELMSWTARPGTWYTLLITASDGFRRIRQGKYGCGLRRGMPQMNATTLLTTETPIAGLNGPAGTYTGTVASLRIPALATTNDGTLLATVDARVSSTGDLPNNIQIVLQRSTDNGVRWSPPRIVHHAATIAEGTGDSSLLVDRATDRIFLFYNYAPPGIGFRSPPSGSNSANDPKSLHVQYIYSDDDGLSWSDPVELNPSIKDPTWGSLFTSSGHGIQLAGGRLLQPLVYRDAAGVTHAADIYSDDDGATWHTGGSAGTNVSESKAIQLGSGAVLQNMRANAPGFRYLSVSHDDGTTFGPMWTSALIDPSCNADELSYLRPTDVDPVTGTPVTTDTALFSNSADRAARINLTVRLSHDGGASWSHSALLAPGQAGYSTMTVLSDGSVGDLYEVGATGGIVFDRFTLDWVYSA